MSVNERANFGSKIGVILASAGSAVGLGNIWRFPSELGSNGGAAFLLVYLLCIVFLGLPVMVSEFLIGRRSQANTASETGSRHQMASGGTHGRVFRLSDPELLCGRGRMDSGIYGSCRYKQFFTGHGLYGILQ